MTPERPIIGRVQMRFLRLTGFLALVFAVAGCGGSGESHTYVLAAGSGAGKTAGIYVTIVSPVAIPTNLMTARGAKMVGKAQGPQVCSFTQTVQNSLQNGDTTLALLKGKAVTLKINASRWTEAASLFCTNMKKAPFDITRVAGT